MTQEGHNIIVVFMIPEMIEINNSPWVLLPEGVHSATLEDVSQAYGKNPVRRRQFNGLVRACKALASAGCKHIFLDGSYVTGKPVPGDYDACWAPDGVSVDQLDPVFLNFDNKREAQKLKYGGEFFPFSSDAGNGQSFLDFFQTDRYSGSRKGIVIIDLTREDFTAFERGRS